MLALINYAPAVGPPWNFRTPGKLSNFDSPNETVNFSKEKTLPPAM